MEIPRKIEKLIERRTRLAVQLDNVCNELDEWLDTHNIEVENEDSHGGVEIYVNPYDSGERIKEAILTSWNMKGNNNE